MADKYASEYPLPGGVDQYFETLIALLRHVGDKPVRHDAVIDFVFQSFPRARGSTAVGLYLSHITRMGFLAVKDEMVRLTPEGSDLIERTDTDPAAAKRSVLDVKLRDIAGYQEILEMLAGKALSLDDVDEQLKEAIGATWKSKNQTTFRLNWLRSLAYLERDGRSYQLTELGQSLAAELAQAKQGVAVLKKGDLAETDKAPASPMVQRATELSENLDQAAIRGLDGADLENLTAEAFRFLGFESQVISGPGNPDVVITAPMGDAAYRVLVDTKSRSSGVVQQNDVNFNALNEHKVKVNADYVMVLGADFSGGNLEKWAQEQKVRLLRIEELRQVLMAHAEGVIALDRLEDLFRDGGSTDEAALSEILADSEHTIQAMAIARQVYDAVRAHQDQEGALNAHSLYYILGGEYSIPAIEATVSLLQSDLLGALGKTANNSLYTRLTPNMLRDKLTQLQNVVGDRRLAEK